MSDSPAAVDETLEIRRIAGLPAEIAALADEAREEGFAFVERLQRDWESGANRFDAVGETLFAARIGSELVGVCGLNRDPFHPDPGCGRLRRLYVRPAFRRRGVARALTEAALARAVGTFTRVRLRTHRPEADRFYRALGFARVAGDPDATHVRAR